MDNDKIVRQHLLDLLRGGAAHIDFDSVVTDFAIDLINKRTESIPYTAWHVIEHMRIAQWDILEFIVNPKHRSPKWPEGYWPAITADAGEEEWKKSLSAFGAGLASIVKLVEDKSTDLYSPIKHGDGQTVLREVLLVADHNAYHLGVLVTMKRILTAST